MRNPDLINEMFASCNQYNTFPSLATANPCTAGTHVCDPVNGVCVPQEGITYLCTCRDGWVCVAGCTPDGNEAAPMDDGAGGSYEHKCAWPTAAP